jgi:homocysteine S-methyltransferase
MPLNSLNSLIKNQIILLDGGVGTQLDNQLKISERNKPIEYLNITNPNLVLNTHLEYINAGSSIITTNTFAANSQELHKHGLINMCTEINEAGAQLAQKAKILTGNNTWIAGSVGPLNVKRDSKRNSYLKVYTQQMEALAIGGADLLILETFNYIEDLIIASKAAQNIGINFITQMTFGNDGMSLSGYSPAAAANTMEKLGALAIGANCSTGFVHMISTIKQMSNVTALPLIAQPNAGFPSAETGRILYKSSPSYMSEQIQFLIKAGASLVGGCCGTTPSHIEAFRDFMANNKYPKPINTLNNHSKTTKFASTIKVVPSQSDLQTKIKSKKLILTMEVAPPKGFNTHTNFEKLEKIRAAGIVDALNITDNPRAQGRMSPLAMASLIQSKLGMETIMHVAVRNKNYLALHSDLMGAYALGIKNIFAVMGDAPDVNSLAFTTTFSDMTASKLLKLMQSFNKGVDLDGGNLGDSTTFFKGAAFNPSANNLEKELKGLDRKLRSGADFLLTQPVYNSEDIIKLEQKLGGFPVPVIVGILPLRSLNNAKFLQNEVPGIDIPDFILEKMRNTKDTKAKGMEISVDIAKEIKGIVSGIYYIPPFGNYSTIIDFCEMSGIK